MIYRLIILQHMKNIRILMKNESNKQLYEILPFKRNLPVNDKQKCIEQRDDFLPRQTLFFLRVLKCLLDFFFTEPVRFAGTALKKKVSLKKMG